VLFSRNKIVLLGLLILALGHGEFDQTGVGRCAFKKAEPVIVQTQLVAKLTYWVDYKKGLLKFSQKQIYLRVGDYFTVKAGDLLLGSDCLECLDVDWLTTNGISEYIFTGLQAGELKLKFASAFGKQTGEVNVLITNNAAGKAGRSGFKKITYQLVDDKIILSKRKVAVHKGERLLLAADPEGNDWGRLILSGDYDSLLEKKELINGVAACYAFKAINPGSVVLECQTKSESAVKATLKVTVKD
jgi:hypothetical protein